MKHFRPRLSRRAFWVLCALLVCLRLALTGFQQAYIWVGGAPLDDELMFRAANHITAGQWLGAYDYLTLSKAMFFPVWLALLHALHLPYLISGAALWCGAALLAAFAFSTLWRKKDSAQGRVLTLGLFAALAFLPSSWAAYTLRIYRDNIFPALCLYFFAGMAGMALRAVFTPERPLWPWLAALVLPLPLLHTHSALALVLLCLVGGVYTLAQGSRRKTLLPWLGLAAVCGAAWLCQMLPTVLAQSLDGQHMLRLHFNWINGQDDGTLRDNYFWFYIKNIGLVYLLLIPAFLRARPKQRWLYGGGLAILALAEFVVFQPNNYDNNKLLYVWHILGCILAAQLLVDIFAEVRALPWRALGLAACCFAGMFGSVLTVGREALSDYRQWSADDMALADHIDENAGSDALFLTSDSHLTPVFALAGRRILCGSGSYVYYHGMDYSAEYNAMRALYETPDEDTLAAWDIGYAVFDSSVYAKFAADESWYAARYDVWYENAACRVYKIK